MTTSAIYALIHKLERDGGVWFAAGGTNALVAAMARHFARLGGTLRLHEPVQEIETEGNRVTRLRTRRGGTPAFDAIATNGDVVHSYGLIKKHRRGAAAARRLRRKRHSPSLFVLHVGARGSWPGVAHHSILFGPRYEGLIGDIFERGRLAADPSLYVHHPSATDPGMAPEGCSTLYALAPVPHLGKGAIDWESAGPAYRDRILEILEARLLPGLRDRIQVVFHYTPHHFADDLNAHLGSAFSLEPRLLQSAWFRVHNRDAVLRNFYFVGAGTHPGAGIPGVVGSAKATAGLILDDLG
jgi:phytoene desaturase